VTFTQRTRILIGAAVAAGLIGVGFAGTRSFQGGENPAARGDGTPIDVPLDNSAEIDLDGDDDATEIPFDNSAEIDVDGDEPGEDAVGDPDDDDVSGGVEEPGEDAVGDPDDDDLGGDEPGAEPVEEPGDEPADEPADEPGKCDLDPEAEGCEPKTPWNPDLDILNPEDEKPDPPFPGNELDVEAQPEGEDPEPDPDPVFNPDFDIKDNSDPKDVKIGKLLGVN
jgi:hypothetical protein